MIKPGKLLPISQCTSCFMFRLRSEKYYQNDEGVYQLGTCAHPDVLRTYGKLEFAVNAASEIPEFCPLEDDPKCRK